LLYTEMVVADAIIHGPRERLLSYAPVEHPIALQIGGSDPQKLIQATQIADHYSYDEININIGCPSDRVQSGAFGACLMNDPDLVANCYEAMQGATDTPVTVKCRLGVDDQEVEKTLPNFIQTVSQAGCKHFIIHARKAWLKGLSPKENRDVPPLDYELVCQMKALFPDLEIVLNGGLQDIHIGIEETQILDGFMLGRAAYNNPWILTQLDETVYGADAFTRSRYDIVEGLIEYTARIETQDQSTKAIIRHIMGLFLGQKGARVWRRALSEGLASGLPPSAIIAQARDKISEMQNMAAA